MNTIYIGFASELEQELVDKDIKDILQWEIKASGNPSGVEIEDK